MDEAIRRVTKVFGVHSVCRAIEMEKDSFEALCAQAAKLMGRIPGYLQGQRPPQRQALSHGFAHH